MTILDVNPSSFLALILHLGLFFSTSVASAALIYWMFFMPDKSEQDQYYLRGNVTKMITLAGNPRSVGGKYMVYRLKLHDSKAVLGADMQRVSISFDYVSDQIIDYEASKSGRYTVEDIGTKGYFEILEREGSDIEKILRRNLGREKDFELSVKGPHGRIRYLGDAIFYE